MNLLANLLKQIQLPPNGTRLSKVVNLLTFKRVKLLDIYRFEYRFNKWIRELTKKVCTHPTTYEDHYWSGGRLNCSVCHKTLKVLWVPKKIEK